MEPTVVTITPEERTLAALTHLSGLSGYLIPLGGVVVPIIIWAVKSDSRVIASVAKQAVLLNLVVFVLVACTLLPIIGAIRAFEGTYYRYPVIGITP